MYSCPACGAEDVAGQSTCRCGADLSLLQRLDAVADVWFNLALEALAGGAPGRAMEWLSACCAARPTDAAARRAQAKVWAQLGCWEEARDAVERARAIEPDAPELAEIELALQDVTPAAEAGKPRAARTKRARKRVLARKRAHR
jgi:tetratricopeptide (TPR) repeat protein